MRSDNKPQAKPQVGPQLSAGGRRRLAISLATLAAVPAVALAACGNAQHKVNNDGRPDARASTNGAQSAFPSPAPTAPAVSGSTLSGRDQQGIPADASPADGTPPEDLVSEQGFGRRNDK